MLLEQLLGGDRDKMLTFLGILHRVLDAPVGNGKAEDTLCPVPLLGQAGRRVPV